MQKGLRHASEVFHPYQFAILRVKPGTSQSAGEAKRSPLLCVGFYGHRCGLHCLEYKLFVLIYKLKIKLCLFAALEGSFAHSCLESELWLPSKIKFNVTTCTGKSRTGNYPASSRTLR